MSNVHLNYDMIYNYGLLWLVIIKTENAFKTRRLRESSLQNISKVRILLSLFFGAMSQITKVSRIYKRFYEVFLVVVVILM
jgi:hypothetical protein